MIQHNPPLNNRLQFRLIQQRQKMAVPEEKGLHQVFKTKFIEGGVPWMTPILILLIIGLAIVIERIIYLNMATQILKSCCKR
jgi:hypothetical protein